MPEKIRGLAYPGEGTIVENLRTGSARHGENGARALTAGLKVQEAGDAGSTISYGTAPLAVQAFSGAAAWRRTHAVVGEGYTPLPDSAIKRRCEHAQKKNGEFQGGRNGHVARDKRPREARSLAIGGPGFLEAFPKASVLRTRHGRC